MLKINTLKPAEGSVSSKKRVGRGSGSGWGKTAGRGMNGAKARSGAKTKPYFEGGQIPLTRRLPKRGFTNIFRKVYQIVNLADIESVDTDVKEIDPNWLYENGLIHSAAEPVKILASGDLTKSLTIKANAFSAAAKEKIVNAKGKVEVL